MVHRDIELKHLIFKVSLCSKQKYSVTWYSSVIEGVLRIILLQLLIISIHSSHVSSLTWLGGKSVNNYIIALISFKLSHNIDGE